MMTYIYNKVTLWARRRALAMALMLVAWGHALAYTVADVPNVRLADASQYVSDPSSILSAQARDSINLMLRRLEKGTGIEAAVVMLPTIGDADIFDFAHQLFRTWGIGKKQSDNGLLVLFVMDQHKVRFTTGYGLEGALPDALCLRIQRQCMVPRFKQRQWDEGMVEGVRATVKVLDGTMKAPAGGDDADDDAGWLAALAVVMLVALGVGGMALAIWRGNRCPRCGRHGLRKVGETRQRIRLARGQHKEVVVTTLVCRYCGHRVTRRQTIDPASGLAAGAAMGSMGRGGGFGGGGFSGGSFGGGSTGGGGATSGW